MQRRPAERCSLYWCALLSPWWAACTRQSSFDCPVAWISGCTVIMHKAVRMMPLFVSRNGRPPDRLTGSPCDSCRRYCLRKSAEIKHSVLSVLLRIVVSLYGQFVFLNNSAREAFPWLWPIPRCRPKGRKYYWEPVDHLPSLAAGHVRSEPIQL